MLGPFCRKKFIKDGVSRGKMLKYFNDCDSRY